MCGISLPQCNSWQCIDVLWHDSSLTCRGWHLSLHVIYLSLYNPWQRVSVTWLITWMSWLTCRGWHLSLYVISLSPYTTHGNVSLWLDSSLKCRGLHVAADIWVIISLHLCISWQCIDVLWHDSSLTCRVWHLSLYVMSLSPYTTHGNVSLCCSVWQCVAVYFL